jgi:hypothetical protein
MTRQSIGHSHNYENFFLERKISPIRLPMKKKNGLHYELYGSSAQGIRAIGAGPYLWATRKNRFWSAPFMGCSRKQKRMQKRRYGV